MSVAWWLANACGVAAFVWPLLLSPPRGLRTQAHATDAPVLVAVLVPLLVVIAMDEARSRHGDARLIALLGALVAVNTLLRLPKGPSGEGFAMVLPILAGWSFGGRVGFLLGSLSMLTSAVVTGGVGPWLPFQMFALGWVGAGAGLARRASGGRGRVWVLGAYAWFASLAYGFMLNLWFWPFFGSTGELFFEPGLGPAQTLRRYWAFYVATSLGWDTGRALLANVPLVVALARPVTELFDRTRDRFTATYEPAAVPPSAGVGSSQVGHRAR